jgi:peptidoglycan/LPS O-acetylase OafA/YrhL
MSSPAERDPVIDTLRGVAIGVVLLLHFALAFGLSDSLLGDVLGRPFVGALVRNGNYGVTLFFVVSGFLITDRLLQRHGRLQDIDLRRFYAERVSRIAPPLVLALLIIVPLGLAGVRGFDNSDGGVVRPLAFWWSAVGSVLSFWHNQLMQSEGYFNYCLNIYWSLSVEEMFYLVFPLLCVSLKRPAWLVAVCLLAVLLGPLYRAAHADDELAYLYAYAACFDAIATGVLCALACRRWPAGMRTGRWVTPLASVLLVAVYLVGFAGHPVAGFSALAAVAAVLIWSSRPLVAAHPLPVTADGWAAAWRDRARAITAPLRWWGRHSYEMYLFHIVLLAGLRLVWTRQTISHDARLPLLLAFLAASSLLAAGVARGLADPLNRRCRTWLQAHR